MGYVHGVLEMTSRVTKESAYYILVSGATKFTTGQQYSWSRGLVSGLRTVCANPPLVTEIKRTLDAATTQE